MLFVRDSYQFLKHPKNVIFHFLGFANSVISILTFENQPNKLVVIGYGIGLQRNKFS